MLCETFMTDGSLKLKDVKSADCVIYARVTGVDFSEISVADATEYRSADSSEFTPNRWRVTVDVQFSVEIPGRAKSLISLRKVTGTARFENTVDMQVGREGGVRQALYQAARSITTQLTEAWSGEVFMAECIFCKIIKGDIPSAKVYEDDLVYAFLDISPINHGHVLVIPKEHHESSATIPEDVAGRMFRVASRVGVALKRKFDWDAFNLHLADGTAAGQVVNHAHLHVVPRGVEDGFRWNWRQLAYEDGQMAEIAGELAVRVAADLAEK